MPRTSKLHPVCPSLSAHQNSCIKINICSDYTGVDPKHGAIDGFGFLENIQKSAKIQQNIQKYSKIWSHVGAIWIHVGPYGALWGPKSKFWTQKVLPGSAHGAPTETLGSAHGAPTERPRRRCPKCSGPKMHPFALKVAKKSETLLHGCRPKHFS